jgi:hypothetical protein
MLRGAEGLEEIKTYNAELRVGPPKRLSMMLLSVETV